jgi:dimethylargininase
MSEYGCQSMFEPLRRVLVRRPSVTACARWRDYGWNGEPDAALLASEHERFCGWLESAGADVVVAEPSTDDPDAVYTFDPALITDAGAMLLRPGKVGRRAEPDELAATLAEAGVPVCGRIDGDATTEGGDFIRLDATTVLAGRSYRTNAEGINQVARLLPGIEVIAYDLPHWQGSDHVLHLLSVLSPLATDLAVCYPPLLPVGLKQLLAARGIELVGVPDAEFSTMGANVLALAPRVALALDGNPVTRRRLEAAGIEVLVYRGDELSLKGDGGPTCLTLPLLRG